MRAPAKTSRSACVIHTVLRSPMPARRPHSCAGVLRASPRTRPVTYKGRSGAVQSEIGRDVDGPNKNILGRKGSSQPFRGLWSVDPAHALKQSIFARARSVGSEPAMPALPRFGSLKHYVNSIHADARTGCTSAVVAGVEETSEVCEHCGAMLVATTRTSPPWSRKHEPHRPP